jgi:hypothetical protein
LSTKSFSFSFFNTSYAEIKIKAEKDDLEELLKLTSKDIYADIYTKSGIFIGRGFKLNELIKIGVTTKVIYKTDYNLNIDKDQLTEIIREKKIKSFLDFYTRREGLGVGVDLGSVFTLRQKLNPKFAIVIKDIFGTEYSQETKKAPRSDPQKIHVGANLTHYVKKRRFAFSLSSSILDIMNASDQIFTKRVSLGFEAKYLNNHSILMGLYHGSPTFGITTKYKVVAISFAYYTKETGNDIGNFPSNRSSIRLKLGWNI